MDIYIIIEQQKQIITQVLAFKTVWAADGAWTALCSQWSVYEDSEKLENYPAGCLGLASNDAITLTYLKRETI